MTFRYAGLPINGLVQRQMAKLTIILVNNQGSNSYTQLINVVPSTETQAVAKVETAA